MVHQSHLGSCLVVDTGCMCALKHLGLRLFALMFDVRHGGGLTWILVALNEHISLSGKMEQFTEVLHFVLSCY